MERARSVGGDPDSFWLAIEPHDRALRALAYRLVGDVHAMDDVLQSAYVKAFRALPTFEGRSSLKTWLYRIVFNQCMDHLRRRRHPQVSLAAIAEPQDARPDPGALVGLRLDLASALDALPVEQRAVVILVDAEGHSYDQAAQILGRARGTVASQLSHARRALRTLLREHGGPR